jgi:hypothetical protein
MDPPKPEIIFFIKIKQDKENNILIVNTFNQTGVCGHLNN